MGQIHDVHVCTALFMLVEIASLRCIFFRAIDRFYWWECTLYRKLEKCRDMGLNEPQIPGILSPFGQTVIPLGCLLPAAQSKHGKFIFPFPLSFFISLLYLVSSCLYHMHCIYPLRDDR